MSALAQDGGYSFQTINFQGDGGGEKERRHELFEQRHG